MNRLIILGNGFDIAHGLPTKYNDWECKLNCVKFSFVVSE